jgi:hypothetical protein
MQACTAGYVFTNITTPKISHLNGGTSDRRQVSMNGFSLSSGMYIRIRVVLDHIKIRNFHLNCSRANAYFSSWPRLSFK